MNSLDGIRQIATNVSSDPGRLKELFERATPEQIEAGLYQWLGENGNLPEDVILLLADQVPVWRADSSLLLSLHSPTDHGPWRELGCWLDPQARGSGERQDGGAVSRPTFEAHSWLPPSMGHPAIRASVLLETLELLPEWVRAEAFARPSSWMACLLDEVRKRRRECLEHLSKDKPWSCVTRLVAPLCLEELLDLPPAEPARLIWEMKNWPSEELERKMNEDESFIPSVDLMGAYFPATHEAIVYRPVVRRVAARLARQPGCPDEIKALTDIEREDLLSLKVEIHELAHGLCHHVVGPDGQGFRKPEAAGVVVHELWAQALVALFAKRYQHLEQAMPLRALLDLVALSQSAPYRTYQILDQLSPEEVRELLLEARTWHLAEASGPSSRPAARWLKHFDAYHRSLEAGAR